MHRYCQTNRRDKMERKQQSPTKIAAMPVSVRYEQHFFLVSFSVPSLVLSKTPAQLCPWSPRLPTVTGFLFCNPGEPLVSMEFVTHSRWLDDLFFYRPVVTEGENYLTKAVSELCTSYMILLGRAWEHVGGCYTFMKLSFRGSLLNIREDVMKVEIVQRLSWKKV